MACPSCGESTHPGEKFCAACGVPLERGCASCGSRLRPGARFCSECGTPVGDAVADGAPDPHAAPSLTERRRVSVLFVDLVGFTPLAGRLDAEDTRALQDRYFRLARETLERYGGSVEKFAGDAVMAVWGAPTAREDDAERAVRAALDLVARIEQLDGSPERLSARAGIATGEAVVTLGAGDQGMVSGDTVNVAARLQTAADPGRVVVDDATRRAAEAGVIFEPAGERDLKGIAEPVATYAASTVVAGRRGSGRSDELEPPFVGRGPELTLLKNLFDATAQERRLRVASLTGEAGIGKSRLAWEFEKYCDGITEQVYWHQGRSPAYGEGITFWALGEMVRHRAGIGEAEELQPTRAKLDATLEEFVTDPDERQVIRRSIGVLLGLGDEAPAERGELFGGWRRLFERIAERGPVVLVFEDLQWADAGLVDFIGHLLQWSRHSRIFVITLARPELHDRLPAWGAGLRNFTSVHLDPLADGEMRQLLTGLVPGLPGTTMRVMLRRAEGIPLYAVETVRMLASNGLLVREGTTLRAAAPLDDVSVPDSLQALVAARLDSLPAAERGLLQQSAVLGLSFPLEGLAAVTGMSADSLRPMLDRLVDRELLRLETDPRSPERGHYQFVQALTREVAYRTLTRRERKERHLAAARYFESLGDDELAGALARHYLDAWRASGEGPEAGPLAAQARVALRAAADRAAALHSYEHAAAFLKLAEDVTEDPAERALLKERAADAANNAARGADARRIYEELIAWYRERGDLTSAARVSTKLGHLLNATGRVDEAIALLTEAAGWVDGDGDPTAGGLYGQLARAHMLHGDANQAVALADRAISIGESVDDLPVVVDALITKGVMLPGRPREAQTILQGAVALADRHGLERQALRGRGNLATLLEHDDPRAALEVSREAVTIARRIGLRDEELWHLGQLGMRLFFMGETEEAGRAFGDTLEDETAPDTSRWFAALVGSGVAAYEGERHRLQELLAEAESVRPPLSNREMLAAEHWQRALVSYLAGDLGSAVEQLRLTTDLVGDAYPDIRAWYGRVLVQLGRLTDARSQLAAMEAAPWRGRLEKAHAQLLRAAIAAGEGQPGAASLYQQGFEALREVGALADLAIAQLEVASLLGAADPARLAAIEELRATCEARGWHGIRERLDAVIADLEHPRSPDRATPEAAHDARRAAIETRSH